MSSFKISSLFFILLYSFSLSAEIDKDTLSVREISTLEQFIQLSIPSKGVIRKGHTIKFLIDKRDAQNPDLYFFNANYCNSQKCSPKEAVFHYDFAKKKLKNFSLDKSVFAEDIYFSTELENRNFIGGRIQTTTIQKSGKDHLIYGVRFIERDLISEEMIRYTMETIKKSFHAEGELSFVQNATHQTTKTVEEWMKENQIGLYTMEQLISNIPYIALNPGVAYGILNFFPESPTDLEPYDLPVFDQVPLDLAVVAGTITHSFQDVGSHVNLKSKERNTPNMVLRDAKNLENLKRLNGKAVKLTVAFTGYKIEEVDESLVFEEYEKKINKPWKKPSYEPYDKVEMFSEMCSSLDAPKKCLNRALDFGGKAASLSFLAHKKVVGVGSPLQEKVGYRLTPLGFGVPLGAYRAFVRHNYKGVFREKLDKLILSEMSLGGQIPLATQEKKKLVREVKELFLNAEIPQDLFEVLFEKMNALKKNVAQNYPGVKLKKIKIRSSANTEDIVGFNGAGLHDSFSAKLKHSNENTRSCAIVQKLDSETGLLEDKLETKSLACAVKSVFASLWSLRAVRERSYKRFDHRHAVMGLAIQPVYTFRKGIEVAANSVLLTRVLGTEDIYGQQISTQFKNGLVTNPTPNTRAELVNVTFLSRAKHIGVNVIQYAKPKADAPALSTTVMSKEKILLHSEIARTVEKAYCVAKRSTYFPGRDCNFVNNSSKKPMALDMEFKTFDNGEVLIKQVRTFSGR